MLDGAAYHGVSIEALGHSECSCSITLAQPEARFKQGYFLPELREYTLCIGMVLVRVHGKAIEETIERATMKFQENCFASCTLRPREQYLCVPLAFCLESGKINAACTCAGSQPLRVQDRVLNPDMVRRAWAAYVRTEGPGMGKQCAMDKHDMQVTLAGAKGRGWHSTGSNHHRSGMIVHWIISRASVTFFAENRGKMYVRVGLRLIDTGGMDLSRGSAMTYDWIEPGHGQILQVGVNPPGVQPQWTFEDSYRASADIPNVGELHQPLARCDGAGLHVPFRLGK